MFSSRTPLALAALGALTLTACTDPMYQPGGERERTRGGALTGAIVGGLAGAATGEDGRDRTRQAVIGAGVGAAVGAGVGALLDRQAAELRNEFDDSRIQVVNTGNELIVRMPQDILFATDSANVAGSLQNDLYALAANLNRYPDSTVNVIGHTDNTGSASYNQDLSERRARAVTAILQNGGVSSARLRAIGRGEGQPIASNLSAEGRAQNRRVDIVIRPN